jgi:hypothetical protein
VKILHFYLMCPDKQRIRLVDHTSYWRHLVAGVRRGPFADRTADSSRSTRRPSMMRIASLLTIRS